jgi:RNA polymerase sigma-70 factor (ECF subfamily)
MGSNIDLEQAVTESFVAFRNPIYRYIIATVGNSGDAEDLTQEVFIRFARELQKGAEIRNLRAWLFHVAHNLTIDFGRRSPAPDSLDEPARQALRDRMTDPNPSAEQHVVDQDWRNHVLSRLTANERRCLEMRAEGLRYREIAEALEIRIPTVQSTLKRAIRKLRSDGDD